MKEFVALTLLLWSILNAANKGEFLAAVEGFSARGLSRPWEESNNERISRDCRRTRNQGIIRFYVNEQKDNAEEDTESTGSMSNSTEEEKSEKMVGEHTKICGSSENSSSSGASYVPAAPLSSNSSFKIDASSSRSGFGHGSMEPMSTQVHVAPTVRSCLKDLWAMTRPANIPAVILFHMLGTYLAIQNTAVSYWRIFFKPTMLVTMIALLLTSATSMLVNDYYDFKLGLDSTKPFQPLNSPSRLPLNVAKRFVSYLYAAALICVTMIPGVAARMAVVMGLMLTFWYTQHLKPRTWLKNVVCASLIALSPLTSGVAAVSVVGLGAATDVGWFPLMQVVSMLFVGILGREITMDINDVEDDCHHGVRTVPVVYGTKFASAVALTCSAAVAGLALVGPFGQLLVGNSSMRRWILATAGGTALLRRSWQVFQTEGRDRDIVQKAVEEGLLTVVLLLASFV